MSTPPSLQARKHQLVRDAIWDAAIGLFSAKGFDETTVDDIARAAGVSRRSFFRYFSSKSDLISHGILGFGDSLASSIQACPRSDSLAQVFRKTVLEAARRAAADPRTRQVMSIAAEYPAAREAQFSRSAELQDRVAAAFSARVPKTSARALMPDVLAATLLAVLSVTFRLWYEHGRKDIDATVDQVLSTLGRVVCDGK